MGIEYVNRCGDRYYLLEGKTKTGKPKYYASRKCTGVAVDKMPEGFEFYEHPEQGLVSVRRIRPSQIQASERRQLEAWTLELAGTRFFVVDIQDDCLVVYAPGTDPAESVAAFARILGPFSGLAPPRRNTSARRRRTMPCCDSGLLMPTSVAFPRSAGVSAAASMAGFPWPAHGRWRSRREIIFLI